ncbi:hypothetical protein J7T55_002556 [Diaporthe amygdali]|uniref:uncharacterized protein n=1 Tax=Phomopsis amygdali TaxID=1214568 RepID=UPI0022FE269B|nr:uncharacterized protein J7T55_002556 [Diaporthe amygdali]KAJ0122045.1 hypothetical protein J7T55_002556 [Diaporthe amygdali]
MTEIWPFLPLNCHRDIIFNLYRRHDHRHYHYHRCNLDFVSRFILNRRGRRLNHHHVGNIHYNNGNSQPNHHDLDNSIPNHYSVGNTVLNYHSVGNSVTNYHAVEDRVPNHYDLGNSIFNQHHVDNSVPDHHGVEHRVGETSHHQKDLDDDRDLAYNYNNNGHSIPYTGKLTDEHVF